MNVFEVTIRVLGGLLSGHLLAIDKELNLLEGTHRRLSGYTLSFHCLGAPYNGELLKLAIDLADRLMPAFNTPTGIPFSLVRTNTQRLTQLTSPRRR